MSAFSLFLSAWNVSINKAYTKHRSMAMRNLHPGDAATVAAQSWGEKGGTLW
jgi:hypothetical protein